MVYVRSTDSLVKIGKWSEPSDGDRAVGNRQIWSKRRVRRGYYYVKNVILAVSWEIYM